MSILSEYATRQHTQRPALPVCFEVSKQTNLIELVQSDSKRPPDWSEGDQRAASGGTLSGIDTRSLQCGVCWWCVFSRSQIE